MEELLTYEQVEIRYNGTPAVKNISFSLRPGEILGIVGGSGSGKTSVLRAATGILGKGGRIAGGEIRLRGEKLNGLPEREMRRIRGAEIGMIFQDSAASFCSTRRIGPQLWESMRAHGKVSRAEAEGKALTLFEKLGFRDGKRILNSYPFELSGGMNQRVGIAAAMLLNPPVLLADEPASALDAVVQKQVIREILLLRELYGTAVILVTHNMGVVSALADTVLVMREGTAVEYGEKERILSCPQHAYTKELLDCVPRFRRKTG